MATIEPPKMPPEIDTDATPEERAERSKKARPYLIGFGVFIALALIYYFKVQLGY